MDRIIKLVAWILCFLPFKNNIAQQNGHEEDYETHVDRVINTFALEMERNFGAICTGSGGQMPYDVDQLRIMFTIPKDATLEEARQLEVLFTERLVQIVNEDEGIRPYLRVFPIGADRARVSMRFGTPNPSSKSHQSSSEIEHVLQAKNMLFYSKEDPSTECYVDLFKEPYEEARAKVLQGG